MYKNIYTCLLAHAVISLQIFLPSDACICREFFLSSCSAGTMLYMVLWENGTTRIHFGDLKVFQTCIFEKGNFISRRVFWNRRNEGSNAVKCNVSEGKFVLRLDTTPIIEANLGLKREIIIHIRPAKEMGDAGGSLLTLAGFEVGTREEGTLPAPCLAPLRRLWVLQLGTPVGFVAQPLDASSSCRKPQVLVDPKHGAIRYYCLG